VKRVRGVLALVFGALALAGCSLVPTTSSPQLIGRSHVPFGLMGRIIPGTGNGRVRFITQPVFIVDATGHLAPSSRIVPAPPVLESVLRQLIIGPTKNETFAGYTSALPKNLLLLSASFRSGVGYIDLATTLSKMPRSQQVLAVGQLVLTAYDVGLTLGIQVKGVELTVAGVVQSSPIPGGHRATVVTKREAQRLLNP
jgi:Sporulation and spore germination